MQPRRPQGQSSPPSTTTTWPISPAMPWAPARSSPPRTRAPPTPEPANTTRRSSKPRPAPRRCSAPGAPVAPPGGADPDPGQLAHRHLGVLGGRLDHAGDLGHHRRRPALDRGLAPGLADPGAVGVNNHALDLGPAKVDPCRMHDPDDASILRKVEAGIGAVADESGLQGRVGS